MVSEVPHVLAPDAMVVAHGSGPDFLIKGSVWRLRCLWAPGLSRFGLITALRNRVGTEACEGHWRTDKDTPGSGTR